MFASPEEVNTTRRCTLNAPYMYIYVLEDPIVFIYVSEINLGLYLEGWDIIKQCE